MISSTFYQRFARPIAIVALLCFPVLLYGAKGAFDSNSNNVLDWLPETFDETQRLFWFVERFGSDEILVVSWEGCKLDDERLDQIAAELVGPIDHPQFGPDFRWFHHVYTGRQTLKELTGDPLRLSHEEAIRRMRGWLVGPNDQTTCAVALISEAGSADRAGAIRFVERVARSAGVDPEELHLGGPTVDAVAIDAASNRWIIEMGLLATLAAIAVSWKCLRQGRLVLAVFVSALFAWGVSLSVVYFLGVNMDAVLMMMPSLVFLLGISAAIHLTNYYTDALPHSNVTEAPFEAIRRGWVPCVLASLTTAIGLGSLMASELVPVRKFGMFSSIGVMLNLVALLLVWPAFVQWLPPGPRPAPPDDRPRGPSWWQPLFATSSRHAHLWLLFIFVILPIFGFGAANLHTSAQIQNLLSNQSPTIQSYAWLQQHVGALVPVEIVLRFPRIESEREDVKTMLHRVELVEQLRRRLAQSADVDSALAASTFAPTLPEPAAARQIMQRRVLAARLSKHREEFLELRLLYDEPEEELWRVSARVTSLNVDYGRLLQSLQHDIDAFLAEQHAEGTRVSATVCGGVPLVFMAQQQLLKDLIESFELAFLLIGATMIVLVRSISGGVLSMIPNVFPALVVFGSMGWLAIPVDIGTMMTASAAMGIAVDDTLHFLTWFRHAITRGHTRTAAVRHAFDHCATAMLQTSVICGLGLLIFLISPFGPISRFGGVMAILLVLALVGDLLLLPALLCGPLGRAFLPWSMPKPLVRPE